MSTFNGKIAEIPHISVDNFTNFQGIEAYFLSHCHWDHMKGINLPTFPALLSTERNVSIYCSDVSQTILSSILPGLKDFIIPLNVGQTSTLKLKSSTFSVTLIPAGHCPGSVMFLFEIADSKRKKRILYTGDFRITIGDVEKFKQFHDDCGNVKKIDRIYLDTTFYDQTYDSFPLRDEAIKEVCAHIRKWLALDHNNHIFLDLRANYGYECLLKCISDTFYTRIHVRDEKNDLYKFFPTMRGVITTDKTAKIHACLTGIASKICCDIKPEKILFILPTAFFWTNDRFSSNETNTRKIRVCYSTHASFSEIKYFLRYLKPRNVTACVVADYNLAAVQMLMRGNEDESCSQSDSEWKQSLLFDARHVKKLTVPELPDEIRGKYGSLFGK